MLASKTARRVLSGLLVAAACVAAVLASRHSRASAMSDSGLDARAAGPKDAKLLLTEYSDFQCPSCRMARPIIEDLLKTYDGKIRFVFRHFPLNQHPRARPAAAAAECAGKQGKFWQMHDQLFEHQDDWVNAQDDRALFEQYAKGLGLDVAAFTACENDPRILDPVERDVVEGNAWQVNATPTLFIGSRRLVGPYQIKNSGPLLIEKLLK